MIINSLPPNDPTSAFGKLSRDDRANLVGWLPLADHMADVASCFIALCNCHALRRALQRAAGRELEERDCFRLAVLVFLHDLGKANSGFQAKRFLPGQRPPGWPPPAGHGLEALLLFSEESLNPLLDYLPLEAMEAWGEGIGSLFRASLSHHGRPLTLCPSDWSRAIWQPVIGVDGQVVYDPVTVLAGIGKKVLSDFPAAFVPGGQFLPCNPSFDHLFAGLVQLADWLGSDTAFFPLACTRSEGRPAASHDADRAVKAIGLHVDRHRQVIHQQKTDFGTLFGNNPYPIQAAMAEPGFGRLVILESETGSGKTEAALWHFIKLFQQADVDSLYFALPTRVSASQVHSRVLQAVRRLWPQDPPLVVRALPGYASADGQEPHVLPGFQVLWPDEPVDEVAHRRWAAESPKRFLAAPVAVGTIDQALFGALQVRHAHLRHALLTRSLLVVDEVHASDSYMTALLERLLQAHLHCGGHALLLSATLGASARNRYLALDPNSPPPVSTFTAACQIPYPAISTGMILRAPPSTTRPKIVNWRLLGCIDDPLDIARQALQAASTGAKVLVIRNTVPAAMAVLQALELCDPPLDWLFNVAGIATLHHSRFSRQDRPLLDAAIEAQLGRTRPPGPCIVIGTQTLEQSLDLDADLLITDLCPMDVLLQRIGRLHRHPRPAEERPEACREPNVWVLTPPGQDLAPLLIKSRHGLGSFHGGDGIYPDLRVIAATLEQIRAHPQITIPADNRHLVEAATHPECLQAIERHGQAWHRLGQEIEGRTGAKRTLAHLHGLEFNKPFAELTGFPTEIDIATRLGIRDRLLTFDPVPMGPFGVPLHQLPVRHFLLPPGLSPDAQPTAVTTTGNTIRFLLEDFPFCYSRFGLERLTP